MNAPLTSPPVQRRALLQWGMALAAGAILPACGSGDSAPDTTIETLPQPDVLQSVNGVLELHIHVKYAQVQADLPIGTVADWGTYPAATERKTLELRTLNGRYIAPTLLLQPGDTLRMWVHNELPPSGNTSEWEYLNHQNSTNMHFHGLHVDPREIRPGVFGDYVVDESDGGIAPGQMRFHEIVLPADHACGIFWYHPHLHGATNAQVSSGMFGAILVQKPDDAFRAQTPMREQIIFAHKLTLTSQGRIDTLEDSFAAASGFLLNGVHQPTIVMRPGEVQHWHMLNPTSFYPLYPLLEGHDLCVYSRDGNHYDGHYHVINQALVDRTNADQFADWPGGRIYPGGRLSMVVQASITPGVYLLKSARCRASHGPADSTTFEEVIARVVVQGSPVAHALPSPASMRHTGAYAPITDEELARHGGVQRAVHLAMLQPGDPLLHPMPADEQWALGGGTASVFSVGSGSDAAGLPSSFAPYHSKVAQSQTVDLGAVEEWTVWNHDNYPHPFHIHVNDCYVVALNGQRLETPFWADTMPIPPRQGNVSGSLTFRTRFEDFHGRFVWHCHALDHEDLGMMQMVEILPTSS